MQKTRNIKIVLTGGHAGSTAYSLIEELKSRKDINWDVYWIGAQNAMEGKKVDTYESKVSAQIGVKFLPLFTGKLQTRLTLWTIPSLFKIPFGFIQSLYYVAKIRPNIVISFGGNIGLPVVISSWLLRVPVILHEQTAAGGRGNIFASGFATKIALARQESLEYFPKHKCVIVGNPVSHEIQSIKPKINIGNPPSLLITGGSRGSVLINETFAEELPSLLEKFKITHITGEFQFEKFKTLRESFPENVRNRYKVIGFALPGQMKECLQQADIVISRAGANTVSELMAIKKPCLLIPLKIADKNEQMKNAVIARDFGIARIIDEDNFNSERLTGEISLITKEFSEIVKKVAEKKSKDLDAAEKLYELIVSNL